MEELELEGGKQATPDNNLVMSPNGLVLVVEHMVG